jgi:hypothetical protein
MHTNYVGVPVRQLNLGVFFYKKSILSSHSKASWNKWCLLFSLHNCALRIKILVLTLHPHHPMSWFQDQECASHSRGTVLHLHHQTKLELFQQESPSDLHEKPSADETYISNLRSYVNIWILILNTKTDVKFSSMASQYRLKIYMPKWKNSGLKKNITGDFP